MSFSITLERFIEQSPTPVMARSLIERTLNADRINACFESVGENPHIPVSYYFLAYSS